MPLTIQNPTVEARLKAFVTDLDKEEPLSAADAAALKTGLDQLDRGEGTEGVAFLENLRQRDGLPPRETGFTRRDAA